MTCSTEASWEKAALCCRRPNVRVGHSSAHRRAGPSAIEEEARQRHERAVQESIQRDDAAQAAAAPQAFPELTEREREILTLIAQGYTNTAIAEQLVLSSKTGRNHVSNIFGKLQVAGRSEAIIRARDAGLGSTKPGGS